MEKSRNEPIKKYFDEVQWDKFSDDEKQRFANIKKNYETLLAIGGLKKSDYDRVYDTVPSLINKFLQKLPHQVKESPSNQLSCSTNSPNVSIKKDDHQLPGESELRINISDEFDDITYDVNDEAAIAKTDNIDFVAENFVNSCDYETSTGVVNTTNQIHSINDLNEKSNDVERGKIDFVLKDDINFNDHGKHINVTVTKKETDNINNISYKYSVENTEEMDFNDGNLPVLHMEDILIIEDGAKYTHTVDPTNQLHNISDVSIKPPIKIKVQKSKLKVGKTSKKEKIRRKIVFKDNMITGEHVRHITDTTNELDYISDTSDKSVAEKMSKSDCIMDSLMDSSDNVNHLNTIAVTIKTDNIGGISNKSAVEKEDKIDAFVEGNVARSDSNNHINVVSIKNEIGDNNDIDNKSALENIDIIDFILDDIIPSSSDKHINTIVMKNRLDAKKSKKLKKKEKSDKTYSNKKVEKEDKKNSNKKVLKPSQKEKLIKNVSVKDCIISKGLNKKAAIAERLKINLERQIYKKEESSAGKKIFRCTKCDYKASQSGRIVVHVKAVHDKCKPHICQKCSYKASQAVHLRRHIRVIHEKKRPFECQKCDYRASEMGNLRMHIAAVHEKKKPYKCSECDYKATFSFNLRRHINDVHKQIKPYLCHKCDLKTSDKRMLQAHVNAIHEGLKSYHCQKCNYKSAWPANLRQHQKRLHGKKFK